MPMVALLPIHNLASAPLRHPWLFGVVALFFASTAPAGAQSSPTAAVDIIVTRQPALLIQVAGEPVVLPVDADGVVERVMNASGELYRTTAAGAYWTRLGRTWLHADRLQGPYVDGVRPPPALAALPPLPDAASPNKNAAPEIYVRRNRTVIVHLTGNLLLDPIGKAGGLHVVNNTDADLFFHGRENRYFLLVGGRWYDTDHLEGTWEPTISLPSAFRDLPADHARGYARVAMPGTREHGAALAEVARLAMRRVSIDRTISVRYHGPPQFEAIPEADVAFATNTTQDVFAAGGLYYACADGVWYLSAAATGPWSVCAIVPDALYATPADHPTHHVTAVVVHPAEEPGAILVGADARYEGWRTVGSRLVHRTWDAGFPPGRIVNGAYFGPYAEGAYLAAEYGNWGRGDWAERRRAARTAAPGSPPAAAVTDATGKAAQDKRWGLSERREHLGTRGDDPAFYGGQKELEERRTGRRGWP